MKEEILSYINDQVGEELEFILYEECYPSPVLSPLEFVSIMSTYRVFDTYKLREELGLYVSKEVPIIEHLDDGLMEYRDDFISYLNFRLNIIRHAVDYMKSPTSYEYEKFLDNIAAEINKALDKVEEKDLIIECEELEYIIGNTVLHNIRRHSYLHRAGDEFIRVLKDDIKILKDSGIKLQELNEFISEFVRESVIGLRNRVEGRLHRPHVGNRELKLIEEINDSIDEAVELVLKNLAEPFSIVQYMMSGNVAEKWIPEDTTLVIISKEFSPEEYDTAWRTRKLAEKAFKKLDSRTNGITNYLSYLKGDSDAISSIASAASEVVKISLGENKYRRGITEEIKEEIAKFVIKKLKELTDYEKN
ncbi:hypothetical protein [Methanopyrus sp.]